MLDESCADGDAGVKEQGEDAGMQIVEDDCFADDGGGEFGCSGMRGMGFDNDGTSGGEGGGGVSAANGEGKREVAGSEDGDGAERTHHGADVGTWEGLAVGESRIDAGIDP
jgi:hypothetical protein